MKRPFFMLLFLLIMSCGVYAQMEHMQFLGIPIDGKISAFQKELKKMGFVSNDIAKDIPKEGSMDCRMYKGSFAEELVDLAVFYDRNSKMVIQTKVKMNGLSKDQADKKYDKLFNGLKEKYDKSNFDKNVLDNPDRYGIGVPNSDKTNFVGYISLAKIAYADKYSVVLEYCDYANFNDSVDREQ